MTQQLSPSTVQTAMPPHPQGTRRRHQAIATVLGASSYAAIDWRTLLQDGVLIQLRIGHCGFTTRLHFDDLGIAVPDREVREKLSKWLVLGEKRLLPARYMKAITHLEGQARYTLRERAFKTELGYFLPSTVYLEWRERTTQLQQQYFALRDELIAQHTSIVQQVLADYEVIARDTYHRVRQTHADLVHEDEQAFITRYCTQIAVQIPSPTRIQETFTFTSVLVDGITQMHPESTERAIAQDEHLAQETANPVATVRAEAEQRAWARAEMDRDLRRHAQERVDAALDSFLGSIVGHLRSLTYDAACDVLATLEAHGNERVSPRSVVQLNNLLAQVRALNFYGDTDMDQVMAHVAQIVDQTPAERHRALPEIQRTLRSIATVMQATLLDLEEEPRTQREASATLPLLPTETAVRQARAELGLDLDAALMAAWSPTQSEVRAERAETRTMQMESLWSQQDLDALRTARTA